MQQLIDLNSKRLSSRYRYCCRKIFLIKAFAIHKAIFKVWKIFKHFTKPTDRQMLDMGDPGTNHRNRIARFYDNEIEINSTLITYQKLRLELYMMS